MYDMNERKRMAGECRVICMSCQNITPREDFQRQLEGMNPEAAAAIKRMVEAEQLLKKRRGPLHPSTEEEIMRAAEVHSLFIFCFLYWAYDSPVGIFMFWHSIYQHGAQSCPFGLAFKLVS